MKKGQNQEKKLKNKNKVVVGLGNPGEKYAYTRHNVGYRAVELFLNEHGGSNFTPALNNLVETADIKVYNHQIKVLRALTFMNLSGVGIGRFVRKNKLDLKNLLVLYDDIDLSPGEIKLRPSGGSGGHKGVNSLIESIGSKKFPRLKIGVGHPGDPGEVSDYVLSKPRTKEGKEIQKKSIQKANEAVEFWIKYGIEEAMNEFN